MLLFSLNEAQLKHPTLAYHACVATTIVRLLYYGRSTKQWNATSQTLIQSTIFQSLSSPLLSSPTWLHLQSRWLVQRHPSLTICSLQDQVVARRLLGEHPALAPCPTAPQCCACCTQRSSARTAGWPADLHLFPRLLSAHTQVQIQIKQKHSLFSHAGKLRRRFPHLHLLWVRDRQETLYECIHGKDDVFPSSTREFLQQLPFVRLKSNVANHQHRFGQILCYLLRDVNQKQCLVTVLQTYTYL